MSSFKNSVLQKYVYKILHSNRFISLKVTNCLKLQIVFQVVLSPIQELDSHQNTITANTPGATALAQAVLNSTLNPAGIGPGTVYTTTHHIPMAVSPVTFTTVSMSNPMLTSLGISPSSAPHTPVVAHRPLMLSDITQLPTSTAEDSTGGSSSGSVNGDDRSRKASVTSQAKRSEVYV